MERNIVKSVVAAAGVCLGIAAAGADPVVSEVTMEQGDGAEVLVTYKLTGTPAVVTFDVETNCVSGVTTNWASIGGERLWNVSRDSDVWKKVSGKSTYEIRWNAGDAWLGRKIPAGGARAVVSAWPTNDPPDYLVVDLTSNAGSVLPRYYPSAAFVPGGVVSNAAYRTTSLLMRKIKAKGVVWTMGCDTDATREKFGDAAKEGLHTVSIPENYYIGVFEVSNFQLYRVTAYQCAYYKNVASLGLRPVDSISYNQVRCCAVSTTAGAADVTTYWPNDPHADSFLGKLRRLTKIDFDLPSEAQWEYACRAGNGDGSWGDGSAVKNGYEQDVNLSGIARYKYNGGYVNGTTQPDNKTATAEYGTALCGSYRPNSWGLYDMHGNIREWCLDWYEDDIKSRNGAVNIDQANPAKTLSGATGANRVLRGGGWSDREAYCRSWMRGLNATPTSYYAYYGFRVCCPIFCP